MPIIIRVLPDGFRQMFSFAVCTLSRLEKESHPIGRLSAYVNYVSTSLQRKCIRTNHVRMQNCFTTHALSEETLFCINVELDKRYQSAVMRMLAVGRPCASSEISRIVTV